MSRVGRIDGPDPVGLLFDLDGTLVDTVRQRVGAWLETFAEAGIPADARDVGPLMGMDGRGVVRTIASLAGLSMDDERAEVLDHRAGELFDVRNVAPEPLPGARALVRALAASRRPWAIATSSRPSQVAVSVAALDIQGVPPIVDASHVAHAKPAPDLLLAGARQLGMAPDRCWYVGDSPADMRAAVAARMRPVGVPTGAVDADRLRAEGAGAVVPDLATLHAELAARGLVAAPRD